MAKIVETKLVFRGDDQASSKIKTITQSIVALGNAVAEATDRLAQMGGALPTGAGGGGGAVARGGRGPSVGSPRSPYAPGGPGRGGGGGGGIVERGGTGYGGKSYMGWRGTGPLAAGLGGAGQMIGAGQALLGGVAGNLTATAGGMLMTAGGAITGTLGGGGIALGGPMMVGGGLMGLSAMLAQPALQHYGTHAGTYRRLGEDRTQQLKKMFEVLPGAVDPITGEVTNVKAVGPYAGILSPEEQMQYAGQLQGKGAFNALGTMAGMRRGGFEPETMMPFFETATKAGAAGTRGVANYEFLGKVLTKAFKDSGMASMGQAIEAMTGVMEVSSQYLADISDTDTKSLAAFIKVGDLSGTAALKGQRGVQAFGGIAGGIAKTKDPAMQMLLWNIFSKGNPGMTWYQFEKYRENPAQAVPAFLQGMGALPRNEAAVIMRGEGMVSSLDIAEQVIDAFRSGGYEAAKKTLSEAELKKVNIAFGVGGGEVGKATGIAESKNLVEQMRLEVSAREGIVKSYQEMEQSLMLLASSLLQSDGVIAESMTQIAKGLAWMAAQLGTVAPTTGTYKNPDVDLLTGEKVGETLTHKPYLKRGPT